MLGGPLFAHLKAAGRLGQPQFGRRRRRRFRVDFGPAAPQNRRHAHGRFQPPVAIVVGHFVWFFLHYRATEIKPTD